MNRSSADSLGDHYQYSFELRGSNSSNMNFEDSIVHVSFKISDKSIDFTLGTKARESLKIDWNDASITMFGRADQVIHNGIKYIKRFDPMPPTIIPSGATINESVIPAFKVYENTVHVQDNYHGHYTVAEGGWKINDLLISWDHKDDMARKEIQKMIGSQIELYLPIRDNSNKEFGYRFSFKINGVKCITCKDGMPSTKDKATEKSKF